MSLRPSQHSFISFARLSFNKDWKAVPDNGLSEEEILITWNMRKLRSMAYSAALTILDNYYKEIIINFNGHSLVGVGSGVIYFNGKDVVDSKITSPSADNAKLTFTD